MSDWRPIESAPKDGTKMLVTDGRSIGLGAYEKFGSGWIALRGWIDPTHWMPVPEPPTGGEDSE